MCFFKAIKQLPCCITIDNNCVPRSHSFDFLHSLWVMYCNHLARYLYPINLCVCHTFQSQNAMQSYLWHFTCYIIALVYKHWLFISSYILIYIYKLQKSAILFLQNYFILQAMDTISIILRYKVKLYRVFFKFPIWLFTLFT